MDHQSQDHPQQQQHLQSMQAPPTASHESQAHATLQPHTPMTALPSQPEQMSPATRPGVVRTGRRGRPPGSKNKVPTRRKPSPSDQKLDDPDDDLLDDSGRGFKTKYGRKVHAPQQFQPTPNTSRKRRPLDETHYCHICTRSGSPSDNKLVFCDNCDTPYHQLCHQPPVDDLTVSSNNKWFCSTCKPPQPGPLVESMGQRLMAPAMSDGQKRAILQTLPSSQLIDLIIYASNIHPNLDLIPAGDVDQFQVPRLQATQHLQRMPDMDLNDHPQYGNRRLPDPQDVQQQPPLPMTPMHDAPPPQQSPLESPAYGQNVDLPHYELMIVNALTAINDPNGSPPKTIWDWMNSNYPCNPKFRASASQALQKALKKGRLLKTGSLYKINPDFNPINAENPKATRKPQVGRLHPLFSQMHSRNNSIATMSSSPMQTPMHGTPQQQQQQQLPPPDLPPLNSMAGPMPQLNIAPREHDNPPTYLDHPSVFNTSLGDPTHPYGDPGRPSSSHEVLPSFTHHPHPM
jgi:hypothetical protein